jgi:hypothetical protein
VPLFRQQFRRDLRSARFNMEFAQSALAALQSIDKCGSASAASDPRHHRVIRRYLDRTAATLAIIAQLNR